MKIQNAASRKIRTILIGLVCLSMVLSLFGAISVDAKEGEDYTAGVVVTPASEEDKSGEYGTAYSIAGYKATFTFIDDNVVSVGILADVWWVSQEDAAAYAASGYTGDYTLYSPYEIYEDGMAQVASKDLIYYTKVDGTDNVWQLEIPVFASEYEYWLTITYTDGTQKVRVADPANNTTKYTEDDTISIFYVGDSEAVEESQRYIYENGDKDAQGTVVSLSVTASNGEAQSVTVYLPAGYDESNTYKTLYLLHGNDGLDTDWFTTGSIANIMDNLIAEGSVEPTVVVAMNNSVYGEVGDYETAPEMDQNIIENIIPVIEGTFSVSTRQEDRAIAGYSGGGAMTLVMMDLYSDYFKYYGICASGRDYELNDDNDFTGLVAYFSSGNLDTQVRCVGTMTHRDEVAALGATVYSDYFNGNHYWAAWRSYISSFIKNYLWCEEEADAAYEGGVVVTAADAGDLTGEYATAYGITGYKATFTYIAQADAEHGDVVGAAVFGDFLWVDRDEVAAWQEGGCEGDPVYCNAYEIYEDDMVQYVTFDFYPMEKVTGTASVYQVSFPVFASEYMYWLRITYEDGTTVQVADPANNSTQYTEEDSVSFLYVGDAASAGEAQEYIYPIEKEDAQGTVISASVAAIYGEEQSVSIYLPAGYDESRTYKSLYVLHGADETDKVWLTGTSLANIMDNLIAEGEVEPTVVIMMDNSIYETSDYYTVLNEIVGVVLPYVEANYSVSTNPDDRAIAGISAGGHEVQIAIDEYTEYFKYYGSFSAYYEHDLPDDVDYSDLVIYLSYGNLEGDSITIAGVGELYAEEDATVTVDIVDGNHYYRAWREAFATFVKDVLWTEYWTHGALILYE